MIMTRFPALLVLPTTLWLATSLGDENCSITRPGGVKEPGVTNIKGECCSSFYSNSGNWDDCVPPTSGAKRCSTPPKMLTQKASAPSRPMSIFCEVKRSCRSGGWTSQA